MPSPLPRPLPRPGPDERQPLVSQPNPGPDSDIANTFDTIEKRGDPFSKPYLQWQPDTYPRTYLHQSPLLQPNLGPGSDSAKTRDIITKGSDYVINAKMDSLLEEESDPLLQLRLQSIQLRIQLRKAQVQNEINNRINTLRRIAFINEPHEPGIGHWTHEEEKDIRDKVMNRFTLLKQRDEEKLRS